MNATLHKLAIYPLTPRTNGFPQLPCILCGDVDGNVAVSLDDLSQFHCQACGGSFETAAVRDTIDQWQSVLDWIDAAPSTSANAS